MIKKILNKLFSLKIKVEVIFFEFKNKIMFSRILFFVIFFAPGLINSQVIVVDNFHVLIEDIDEETVDEVLLSVRNGIKKYEHLADLLDESNKDVTVNTVEEFNELFKRNALIYSDITTKPSVITCDNYSRLVYTYLDKRGVKFNMFSAVIDGIDYDKESGIYTIDVLSRKYLFNGINDNYKPFYCKKGRTFNLRFTFEINEKKLEVAKISKIQGNLIKECKNKNFVINPYSRVGSGKVRFHSSDFFENELSGLNVDFESVRTFSAGIKFGRNLNKQNNILLTLGAGYSRIDLKSKWNGFFEYDDIDEEGVEYNKISQLSNGLESIRLQYIEVPVGVKFRIGDWSSFHMFIEPFVEMKFGINRTENNVHFTGESITYGVYPSGEINFLDMNQDNLLPTEIGMTSSVNSNNLMFLAGTMLSTQYFVNNHLGIELGVDYKFGLSRLLENRDDVDYYPDDDTINLVNFSEIYLDNLQLSQWGLELGIIYRP